MKREAVVNFEESMEECTEGFEGEVTDIVILLKYQEIYFKHMDALHVCLYNTCVSGAHQV